MKKELDRLIRNCFKENKKMKSEFKRNGLWATHLQLIAKPIRRHSWAIERSRLCESQYSSVNIQIQGKSRRDAIDRRKWGCQRFPLRKDGSCEWSF
jgi:hypothetical protein